MTAVYNEIEPFACEWLANLAARGAIAPGFVLPHSIEEITPFELSPYTQVHLFAGVGVWSYALRAAGWPDDRPVWTCSCPCQPFSDSGKGDGFDDPRHLWPHAKRLIAERRPFVIFGEQVSASRADPWFDLVQADLEGMGYAFGLCPFPAVSIGAPHKRERAYWCAVGDADSARLEGYSRNAGVTQWTSPSGPAAAPGLSNVLADADHRQPEPRGTLCAGRAPAISGGDPVPLADTNGQRQTRRGRSRPGGREQPTNGGPVNGHWGDAIWIPCRDGVSRPAESLAMPLAYGLTRDMGRMQPRLSRLASRNRNGRIKGYGNAIVAPAAIEFIRATMAAIEAGI